MRVGNTTRASFRGFIQETPLRMSTGVFFQVVPLKISMKVPWGIIFSKSSLWESSQNLYLGIPPGIPSEDSFKSFLWGFLSGHPPKDSSRSFHWGFSRSSLRGFLLESLLGTPRGFLKGIFWRVPQRELLEKFPPETSIEIFTGCS